MVDDRATATRSWWASRTAKRWPKRVVRFVGAYLVAVFAHDTVNWLRGETDTDWAEVWVLAAIMTTVGLLFERSADPEVIDVTASSEDRRRAEKIVRRGEAVMEWSLVQPVVAHAEETMRNQRRTALLLPLWIAATLVGGLAMVDRHLDTGHVALVALGAGVAAVALVVPPRALVTYRRARSAHGSALPLLQTARSGVRPAP